MNPIPETEDALVLRTDFSDDASWESICAAIREPVGEFKAHVDFISDPAYEGITSESLLSLIPRGSKHMFIIIVDRIALSNPDRPILVVDFNPKSGRTFRVIPSEMWGVQNNLSLANMGFAKFADWVYQDGVFCGFPEG